MNTYYMLLSLLLGADGRIQFLGDCTHAPDGQTVEPPDWPKEKDA